MNDVEIAFNELFYGSGMWLGILILLGLILTLVLKNKIACVLGIPITLFLGIDYITNAETQSHYWGAIIMFFSTVMLVIRLARNKN